MTAPVTITALDPASPATALAAFKDPRANMQWNQASPDWHYPQASVDLRVVGRHVATIDAARKGEGAE